VADADEALESLRTRAVDLVVSDVSMPGSVDGWALAGRLAEERPDVGVLLTSGDPAAARATPDGPELLPKPFTVAALDGAIRRVLGD
jgi:CheY-like chemotaxis protein